MTDGEPPVSRWVWNSLLGLATLALAGMLALIIALASGWNNPRPAGPPDWRAPSLPLHLHSTPGETTMMLLNHPCSDFTVEVEAAPSSSSELDLNGYCLIYRALDADHYFAFAVGSDGYYVILRTTEEEQVALADWQQFPHIRRGQHTNRLRVTCAKSLCQFYINDEYVTSVEDSAWLAGDVGLWAWSLGDQSTAIQFVSLSVWEID